MRDCEYSLNHAVAGSKQILMPNSLLFHFVAANTVWLSKSFFCFVLFGTIEIPIVYNGCKTLHQHDMDMA